MSTFNFKKFKKSLKIEEIFIFIQARFSTSVIQVTAMHIITGNMFSAKPTKVIPLVRGEFTLVFFAFTRTTLHTTDRLDFIATRVGDASSTIIPLFDGWW